jgi:DNA-binding transcriptional MocR family regulator
VSVEATAWAWEQDVKGTKKLVLLALADHADAEHEAWPALSRLETRVGVGRSSVQDAIRALESEGFLERTARTRANGSRTSTLFRLAIARPDDRADPAGRQTPARLDGQPELSGEPPEDVEVKPSLSLSDQVWATYVEAMEPRDKVLHPGRAQAHQRRAEGRDRHRVPACDLGLSSLAVPHGRQLESEEVQPPVATS